MNNQKEITTNQSIKDELEKIRIEFEDLTSPEPRTETLTLELPVDVNELLEDMAYKLRRDEELSHIENLTKQKLCVILLYAIIADYKTVGTGNLTKALIEYLEGYYKNRNLEFK